MSFSYLNWGQFQLSQRQMKISSCWKKNLASCFGTKIVGKNSYGFMKEVCIRKSLILISHSSYFFSSKALLQHKSRFQDYRITKHHSQSLQSKVKRLNSWFVFRLECEGVIFRSRSQFISLKKFSQIILFYSCTRSIFFFLKIHNFVCAFSSHQ